jgi:hypothetical protein
VNVKRYDVEYSTDAQNFKTVGSVTAVSGSGAITYNYLHAIRNEMTGYYRIKSVDMDESVAYSNIEEVKADRLVVKISAYPNPTSGFFKVQVPTNIGSTFTLDIYDAAGKLLLAKKYSMPNGVSDVPVDVTRMPAGYYQVVCEDDKSKYVTRVFKR